ncbi:MAG: hypothetical protein OTJ97_02995 [SAR202 cluster bacterium]|nr:hypothetical protein [SAR202 cluster bacterium]
MNATENTGPTTDPAVLSAIMAAVRAYIDDEKRSISRTPTSVTDATDATAAISAWKSAEWSPLRGGAHRGPLSWRHAG